MKPMGPARASSVARALARVAPLRRPHPARRISSTKPADLGPLLISFERRYSEHALFWLSLSVALAACGTGTMTYRAPLARFLLGPLFLALSAIVLHLAARGRLLVMAYKHGFTITRAGEELAFLYAQLTKVREESTQRAVTLRMSAGPFGELLLKSRHRELGRVTEEIVKRSMPIIAPRCAADFYAGEDLDFGRVKLSRHRLAATGADGHLFELALADIAAYAVEGGRLTIDARADRPKRFCDVPVREIANLRALEMLLSRVCPDARIGAAPPPMMPLFRGR